jgi:hypothetical protein
MYERPKEGSEQSCGTPAPVQERKEIKRRAAVHNPREAGGSSRPSNELHGTTNIKCTPTDNIFYPGEAEQEGI